MNIYDHRIMETPDEAGAEPVGCIHQWFEACAARAPDAVAVECEGVHLTYGELDARADGLAGHLRQLGIGPEVLVGLCLERSLDMVVAILAVLKAGGAYLPLDPDYPQARLAFMVEDAEPKAILTHTALRERLPAHRGETICLDAFDWHAAPPAPEAPASGITPDNLAYCIFTSGSTGKPKGVLVTHRAVCNHMTWMQREFPLSSTDRVLQSTSFSFDASVWEFFAPLLAGSRLVLARPERGRDVDYLTDAIVAQEITVFQVVPTLLQALLARERLAQCSTLRRVFCGGEVLSGDLATEFARQTKAELVNLYGPTECCIDATFHRVEGSVARVSVPIGRPIDNMRVYLLDGYKEPVPAGVVGELYIGGPGVARGYLNRPELTAERFVADPFGHGPDARLYRTGDLGRYLADGSIEFVGRVDDQVKIRGYRIDPGEIEAALNGQKGVRQSVVVLRDHPSGDKQLVAYFLVEAEAEVAPAKLRASLADNLPDYMLPSAFVVLDAWPLTANNKIDRAALPEPRREDSAVERPFVAPRTATEARVAALWAEALGLERVGVQDGFFELGGHSLVAARICAQLRDTFRVPVGIGDLLSARDVASLASLIDSMAERATAAEWPDLRPVPRDGALPPALYQQQVLFLYELAPDSLAYNNQVTIRLRGQLDIAVLEHALSEIVRRHELLRTTFDKVDGEWRQTIRAPWKVHLSAIEDAPGRVEALFQHRFDPARLPLVQWTLVRIAPRDHVLVHVEHHLVHDGWSLGVFLRELGELYTAYRDGKPSPLPELPVQFADFAVWQRQVLQGEALRRLLGYWAKKMAGPLPVLDLQADRARPSRQSFRGAEIMADLSPSLAAALRAFARGHKGSLFTVMLAGFYALLRRYTGQDDIIVGSGFANRQQKGTEGLIGMVLNMLPLRADLSGDPGFAELVARVQQIVQEGLQHQELPFELLVENLDFARDPSRNPLCQVAFSFHDAQVPAVRWPGLAGETGYPHNGYAKLDMNIIVVPWAEQQVDAAAETRDQRITIKWDYNTDLFDRATVERMFNHYVRVLEAAVTEPRRRVSEIELLDQAERRQVLVEWNDTTRDYPRDQSIHALFEAEVARAPEATAVVFGDAVLTYEELNRRANRLAHHLRGLGVGPEVKVGICLDRSIEMVVGILAILKAGGAYVPLDPEYPKSRLQFMIEDIKGAALVTQSQLRDRLPATSARVVCLDLEQDQIARASAANPISGAGPDSLAYVMYTSGSTGTPKGVCVEHRSVVRLVKNTNYATFGSDEVFLHHSPISFDASTFELWASLLNGAKVVVFRPGASSVEELARAIRTHRVSTLWITAALFNQMVETELATLTAVRQLLAGGEALSVPHVRRMLDAMPVGHRLINGYGPTESTTFTACHAMTRDSRIDRSVPIGRPIANTQVYILDEWMRPVPVGVAGELCIAGDGLAREYLNQSELTAEKFVANPFRPERGARSYRTGDLACYRSDGNIEFLGRKDAQIKLNGFRIELGEIEAVLAEHPDVRRVAALVRDDGHAGRRLVAYVERKGGASPDSDDLRRFLRGRLPGYMVPTSYLPVDELPLTANGKVDRGALLARRDGPAGRPRTFVVPRTATERTLKEIWEKRFGHGRFGVEDEFFDIGGHSLLAVSIFSDIAARFGTSIPLSTLFESPTIAALARSIDAARQRSFADYVVPIREDGTGTPIFALAAAGGSAITFAPLSKALTSDRPFYGLEMPGVEDGKAPFDQIADIAAFLREQLHRRGLNGPFVLLGACSGALVAFELACLLAGEGRTVDWVVMIDPSPTGEKRRKTAASIAVWRKLVLPRFVFGRIALYVRTLRALSGNARRQFIHEKLLVLREIIRTRDVFRGSRREIAQNRALEATVAALQKYTPRSYQGPVALLLGERFDPDGRASDWSDWRSRCTGRLEVTRIPGASTGIMFKEPIVGVLAERIGAILGSVGK